MIYLSERKFLSLVRQAYREVPPSMKRALHNLDIVVEEWPSPDDLESVGEGQTLFGLYMGVPLTRAAGGRTNVAGLHNDLSPADHAKLRFRRGSGERDTDNPVA